MPYINLSRTEFVVEHTQIRISTGYLWSKILTDNLNHILIIAVIDRYVTLKMLANAEEISEFRVLRPSSIEV